MNHSRIAQTRNNIRINFSTAKVLANYSTEFYKKSHTHFPNFFSTTAKCTPNFFVAPLLDPRSLRPKRVTRQLVQRQSVQRQFFLERAKSWKFETQRAKWQTRRYLYGQFYSKSFEKTGSKFKKVKTNRPKIDVWKFGC